MNKSSTSAMLGKAAAILIFMFLAVFPVIAFKIPISGSLIIFILCSFACTCICDHIDQEDRRSK